MEVALSTPPPSRPQPHVCRLITFKHMSLHIHGSFMLLISVEVHGIAILSKLSELVRAYLCSGTELQFTWSRVKFE